MASAEAARKIPLRFSGQAEVPFRPVFLQPAPGGDNGCGFGQDCLVKPRNWPAFHSWILKSVASLIPDNLNWGSVKRWELLKQAPDPDCVADIAVNCRKCCGYVDKVVDRVQMVNFSGPWRSV